jgi:poly(3-hydroxybutyrate) depolymerase
MMNAVRHCRALSSRIGSTAIAFAAPLALAISSLAHAAVTLPAYNVDVSQTSVSGLSSGGFMAVQLHVAYSATFKAGAGIVAGGPFYCAQGSVGTATGPCMAATSASKPATATLISTTNTWASQGVIDPTSNLTNSRVYLYSGTIDSTVKQLVMNEANTYYKNYVTNANIFYKNNIASEHAMVTDYFGSSCNVKGSPYIDNCRFDLAGEMLKWIYGSLNPKNTGTLGGSFIEFNQTDFIANPATHGMANTGWLYVPAACGSNQTCKLHVVVHGCQQDPTKIQDKYYRNTGYNKWADTNNIIVLYPQTAPSSTGNPNGCWDWWGYDDPNYAKKSGRQMAAIKGMVDKIASAYVALPAPTGVAVTGSSDTSISLQWNAVSGAAGYNVYRMGSKVNSSAITGTTYTDAGLQSGTSYSYTVRAVTGNGASSRDSAAVTGTTTGNSPPLATPTGLAVGSTTASSVALTWNAASGGAGYNVYRNGTKVTASPVPATSYTDSGLAANTIYSYQVSSTSSGRESALSASVSATTTSACMQTTASNYAHVQAGRAHDSGGYALANGSNQNMGLDNTFYTATLAQTAPGYYVIGSCP